VVLPDLPRHAVGSATRRLAGAGLLLDPAAPELGVTACTGRPGCAKALSDVRADALVAAGHAAGTVVGPRPAGGAAALLPVHWSGCSRRCGRPVGPAVDVVAEPDGYRVLRDGQLYYAGADLAGVRAATAQARAGR
jgi:precorrin-3B synthase